MNGVQYRKYYSLGIPKYVVAVVVAAVVVVGAPGSGGRRGWLLLYPSLGTTTCARICCTF